MNDRVAGLRSRANLLFVTGQPDAGRVDYQKALNVFSDFAASHYDEFTKKSTHVWTERAWAYSEAGIGAREASLQHLAAAESHLAGLMPSPGLEQLRGQIVQARMMLSETPRGSVPPSGGMTTTTAPPSPGVLR